MLNNYASYPALDSYEKTLQKNLEILKSNQNQILKEIEEKKKLLENNLASQLSVKTKLTAANEIRMEFFTHDLKPLNGSQNSFRPIQSINGLSYAPLKPLTTKDLKSLTQDPIKLAAPLSQDILDSISSLVNNLSAGSYTDPASLWPQDLGDPTPSWKEVSDSYYFGSFAKK